MKTYYYAHTGHRIGLDRFRRATTILNALEEFDITLLTSDYRIAMEAREFGIEKSVGIDVVRNIPNIAKNGDRLILDSDEVNPIMLEDMKQYFSTFIHVKSDECVVDEKYFGAFEKNTKITYFFGDDDYEKDLEKHLEFIDGLDASLQLGFYYFLDYEDMLKKRFANYFEFEEYDTMIKSSEILITASPQAALESLAAGGKPIYLQREDYPQDFKNLFHALNIPMVYQYDKKVLTKIINSIDNNNYKRTETNCNKTVEFIKNSLT